MKGSCSGFWCLGPGNGFRDITAVGFYGVLFHCSKDSGHGGRHCARITNSPLGWIVAVWA